MRLAAGRDPGATDQTAELFVSGSPVGVCCWCRREPVIFCFAGLLKSDGFCSENLSFIKSDCDAFDETDTRKNDSQGFELMEQSVFKKVVEKRKQMTSADKKRAFTCRTSYLF